VRGQGEAFCVEAAAIWRRGAAVWVRSVDRCVEGAAAIDVIGAPRVTIAAMVEQEGAA
jgi:hypothetical protein